jgi:hypothetical protein
MAMRAGMTYISHSPQMRQRHDEVGNFKYQTLNLKVFQYSSVFNTFEQDHEKYGHPFRTLRVSDVDVANIDRNFRIMKGCENCRYQLATIGIKEANNCISVPMLFLWHAGRRLSMEQLQNVHMLQILEVPDFLLANMDGVNEVSPGAGE